MKSSALPCLSLALFLASSGACVAQSVNYGRSPSLTNFGSTPSIEGKYQIDGSVSCPSPSLNISGFAGRANDWANQSYDPYASANSGVGNYGVSVGLSLPIGDYLRDFCQKYTELRNMYETKRVENILLINFQSKFNACLELYNRFDKKGNAGKAFADEAFNDEKLGGLLPCRTLLSVLEKYNGSNGSDQKESPSNETKEPTSQSQTNSEIKPMEDFTKPPVNYNIRILQ